MHEIFVQPRQILPKTDMNNQLRRGAVDACHPLGWVQPRLLTVWFHHLTAKSKRSEESPVSFVLDSHFSNMRLYRFQSSRKLQVLLQWITAKINKENWTEAQENVKRGEEIRTQT